MEKPKKLRKKEEMQQKIKKEQFEQALKLVYQAYKLGLLTEQGSYLAALYYNGRLVGLKTFDPADCPGGLGVTAYDAYDDYERIIKLLQPAIESSKSSDL